MSSLSDPAKMWQDMIELLNKAAPGSDAPELVKAMFTPMQQQFDLLQQAFEKQAEFQRELAERALAPMKQMYTEMQRAAESTRAAGEALQQAGEMFTKQANAMDEALKLAKPFLDTAFPPKQNSGAKESAAAT